MKHLLLLEKNVLKQNKQCNFLIAFVSLGLGLFLQTAAVGQSWSGVSNTLIPSTPNTTKVGIGNLTTGQVTSPLTVLGNIELKTNTSALISAPNTLLTIRAGDATTSVGKDLTISGSSNSSGNTPGPVIISSGRQGGNASVSELHIGYGAICIGQFPTSYIPILRNGNYLFGIVGKMIAEEVVVKLANTWPDFVFAKNYQLRPLTELETYIKENQHLPGIPSECDLKEKDGIAISDMLTRQMQKIEELTLYLIEQDKALQALRAELETIKAKGGVK